MRPSKKSRITLPWNNLFGIFVGLYLGLAASLELSIALSIAVLGILVFVIYRFGVKSAATYLLAFLLGFLTIFIKSRPPGLEHANFLVIDSSDNYFIVQRGLFRLYVPYSEHRYQIGDVLRLSGSMEAIDFSQIEGQFDFEEYLRHRGVGYGLENATVVPVFKIPWRIDSFKARFLVKYDEMTAVYLEALIFTRRDYESEAIKRLDALNLIHLLNVSGLLIYMVLRAIKRILARFVDEEQARKHSFWILLPWLLLVPDSVVLWRVVGGGILNLVGSRKRDGLISYWDKKGLLGVNMLLVSKYLVYNPSFYLSFGLGSILYLVKRPKMTAPWWRRYGYGYLPMVILLPYLIITKGSISLSGMIIMLPLACVHGIILSLGLLQTFTIPIPGLVKPFVRLSRLLLSLATRYPLTIHFHRWSWIEICLYFLLIALVMLFSSWSYRRLRRNAVTLLAAFIIFQALPVSNLYETAVYFINVGQGDAILIRNRGQAVLVDTGGSLYLDVAETALIPFFHRHGIDRLDTVIITHDDFDHAGALEPLVASFQVQEIITEPHQFPLSRAGIAFYNLNSTARQGEENTESLVLYFHFDDYYWLLMGDAPTEIEEQIIRDYPELKADHLKIGHHGSDTSTSVAFLNHVRPQEAIISVGRNYYGHPSSLVLNRLRQAGITIRRTDLEGTIAYV
jgi:competence protein ComEC